MSFCKSLRAVGVLTPVLTATVIAAATLVGAGTAQASPISRSTPAVVVGHARFSEAELRADRRYIVSRIDGFSLAVGSGTRATETFNMTYVPVVKVLGAAAHANGRVNVLLANGRKISILAADKSLVERRMAHPDTTVRGSCGLSYVNLKNKSNGDPVYMWTGFEVNHEAISYSWQVYIVALGSSYEHTYNAGGGLDFDSTWEGTYTSSANPARGTYLAEVESDNSYALLDTGDICVSGGPEGEWNL